MKFIEFFTSVLLWLLLSGSVHAAENNLENIYSDGLRFYARAQYSDAELAFSQIPGYRARMGQAMASYQLKTLKKSAALFKQSVLLADNDRQRFNALYNAATCEFLSGDYYKAYQIFSDAEKYYSNSKTKQFIELSKYLSDLVLAQLARDNADVAKKKSSEGKKTTSLEFVFDESINLRIEDKDETESETNNVSIGASENNIILEKLVSAGIDAVEMTRRGESVEFPSVIDLDVVYEFSQADFSIYTPKSSNADLWKRVFELEQGYPASLDQAEIIPGVKPW